MSVDHILYVIIRFYRIILKINVYTLPASIFFFIKQVVSSLAFRSGASSVLMNKY